MDGVLVSQLNLADVAGAALLIIARDGTVYQELHGVSNIDSREPLQATGQFRLASVAKQFTAGCLVIAQRNGLLSWDDKIQTYLPELPSAYAPVTVRHVIHHMSGVPDYEKLMSEDFVGQILDAGVLDLLTGCNKLYFAPGDRFQYSNSGYALLTCVLERVIGMEYATLLQKYLLDPAGLQSAVAWHRLDPVRKVADRVTGHVLIDGVLTMRDQSPTSAVLGDGGIYCSLEDYKRWVICLGGDKIFTSSERTEIFSPGMDNAGAPVPYGVGWRLENRDGRWWPYHPGSSTGFSHCVRYEPETGALVALLTNTGGTKAVRATENIWREVLG